MLRDETNDVFGNRQLEMIKECLVSQDRDSVLKIRELDVGDHSPLKPTYQTSLESRYLRGRTITRQDNLPTRLIQSVERVEELFLGCFLALQELHIVHKEQICLPVSSPKILHGAVLNGSNHLVGELLSTNKGDSGIRMSAQYFVSHGLHQVGFTQTRISVEKKWVIDLSRCLRRRKCGSSGQFI